MTHTRSLGFVIFLGTYFLCINTTCTPYTSIKIYISEFKEEILWAKLVIKYNERAQFIQEFNTNFNSLTIEQKKHGFATIKKLENEFSALYTQWNILNKQNIMRLNTPPNSLNPLKWHRSPKR